MPKVAIDKLRIPNEETVIPRFGREAFLISEYAAAMRLYEGWGEFPEIIVDQDYLVLCGNHRVEAAEMTGLVTAVPAKIIPCDTIEQRLLIVAEGNAKNGRRWSSQHRVDMTLFAERVGIDLGDLARALRVPVSKVERSPRAMVVRRSNAPAEPVYVKRSVRPALQGKEITPRQAEVMRQLTTPNSADKIILDLLRLAELDALPPLNADSHREVLRLQAVLVEWVERDAHLLETQEVAA